MEHVRPYEKLVAWQLAHELCLLIYRLTKAYPADEKFGLVSQMRRSSSSIPINIAEGNCKRSAKEKFRFFEIALGSLEELHYQTRLSRDLQYLDDKQYEELNSFIQRTGFLLGKLLSSLS